MRSSPPAIPIAAWLYRASALFVLAACVVTLAAWPIVRAYDASRIDVVEARERGYVEAAVLDVGNGMREITGDLRVAATLPAMRQFLEHGGAEQYAALGDAFRNIMEAYGRYERIRLIDERGRESLRVVNGAGHAILVPQQDVAGGAHDLPLLERDAIAIAPMELAVEDGRIALPPRPSFRIATPVFDAAGIRRGSLVLEVEGRSLTDRIREIMKAEPSHRTLLVDARGRWVDAADPAQSPGPLPGGSADLPQAFPAEWAAIAARHRGSIRTAAGLFVFGTIPLSGAGAVVTTGGVQDWKLVSFIAQATLERRSLVNLPLGRGLFALIYLLLLALSLLVAYVSLHLKRTRAAERIAAREIEDLYEHAPCGYHSLDRNGMIVRMNQTELSWLGYRADEVIGRKHITELITEDSRKLFRASFPRLIRSEHLGSVDVDFVRKDGSLLPVTLNATAVRDEAGNFLMSRSTVFDATQRRQLESELKTLANTDALTGIGNRRHFFELAAHELARSVRSRSPLSLLLLDIDEFKKINDTHGHEAGDAVLRSFTAACAGMLRDIDVFARFGGEEFVALLPGADRARALTVAERLRQQVSAAAVPWHGQALTFTVSIGVGALDPADPKDDIDAMLRRADAALYQAKNAGRNRVRVSA